MSEIRKPRGLWQCFNCLVWNRLALTRCDSCGEARR